MPFVNLQGLKARGNVEDWLGKVEEAMFASVKRCMKHALKDYMVRPRVDWVQWHPNQVSFFFNYLIDLYIILYLTFSVDFMAK